MFTKPAWFKQRWPVVVTGVLLLCAVGLLLGRSLIRSLHALSPVEPVSGTVGQRHILVDQFGYYPDDVKVAVIRNPVRGYDKADAFAPGQRYAVRHIDTHETILTGRLRPWNAHEVQASSGDQGWWFDFSAIKTPGRYEIVDLDRDASSAPFEIGNDVYRKVLKAALRTFFYQRSGFAKREPYAQACWVDDAAYLGREQDPQARDVTDVRNAEKNRNLRGGWFDAGDTNKYVTFAAPAVHQLLAAFETVPKAFGDDLGIPESGNGLADILNEVRWETDWFKRMQLPSGGFMLKVGATKLVSGGLPSKDASARFYVPECTSATISGAGVLAHAAIVFKEYPALRGEARDLESRARLAWGRYAAAARLQTRCDTGQVLSGNADLSETDQKAKAAEAAIYLFALTGDDAYLKYIEEHYNEMQPYRDIGWGTYHEEQGHALLWLTTVTGVPDALRLKILQDFSLVIANGTSEVFGFGDTQDLYRSYLRNENYHWGSHEVRANYGNVNLDAVRYGAASDDQKRNFRQRALETLHYFHGVNPFGLVMLTNMQSAGATRSVDEAFHTWYSQGTEWSDARASSCGPAPGYLVGGANANVTKDGVPATAVPPAGQPLQKSFRVSNDPRIAAWTFTEPAIYYQSAYIKLLSALVQ